MVDSTGGGFGVLPHPSKSNGEHVVRPAASKPASNLLPRTPPLMLPITRAPSLTSASSGSAGGSGGVGILGSPPTCFSSGGPRGALNGSKPAEKADAESDASTSIGEIDRRLGRPTQLAIPRNKFWLEEYSWMMTVRSGLGEYERAACPVEVRERERHRLRSSAHRHGARAGLVVDFACVFIRRSFATRSRCPSPAARTRPPSRPASRLPSGNARQLQHAARLP